MPRQIFDRCGMDKLLQKTSAMSTFPLVSHLRLTHMWGIYCMLVLLFGGCRGRVHTAPNGNRRGYEAEWGGSECGRVCSWMDGWAGCKWVGWLMVASMYVYYVSTNGKYCPTSTTYKKRSHVIAALAEHCPDLCLFIVCMQLYIDVGVCCIICGWYIFGLTPQYSALELFIGAVFVCREP